METLFDDDVPPELLRSLRSLAGAEAELGVPYPYSEHEDSALLTRIKIKYPDMNVADLVDDFLVWCVDARPWLNDKGKPTTIRWRSRLWTRARNQGVYKSKNMKNRKSTHYVAQEHSGDNEVLDKW